MDAHDTAMEESPRPAPERRLREDARDGQLDTGRDEADHGTNALLVLLDHTGTRFLLPFEKCRTWNDFKTLVSQVYSKAPDWTQDVIGKDEFDIQTSDDEHVLPVVWESIIGTLPLYKRGDSSYTVRLAFREDTIPADARSAPQLVYVYQPPVDPVPVRSRRDDDRITRIESGRNSQASSRGLSRPQARTPSIESTFEVLDRDSSEDSGEDSATLTEDESEDPELVTILPPPRTVVTPTDRDGNPLSFLFDTKWPLHSNIDVNQIAGTKGEEQSKPRNVRDMKAESLKIVKAISVTSDSRTTLQLHTFPGPENTAAAKSVDVRWYHLQGDQLDFSQFKNTCLSVEGLSERLRRLTTKTLAKIENEKLKAFLDGMFIEPGTVLRGDEKHETDPHSVIFSCIPYFDIQPPFKPPTPGKTDRLHPPRSLMQSYYPYEPVRERDREQVFTKFANGSSSKIIQVPSLWMMNIGTHAVVTCGYHLLSSDFVKSITVVQEDIKAFRIKECNTLTNIRLTDWEGRVLLYSPAECRSYFEMEQILRELKIFAQCGPATASLQLAWNAQESRKKITPGNWLRLFRGRTGIFINLAIVNEKEARELDARLDDEEIETEHTHEFLTPNYSFKPVPPFFQWPLSMDPKIDETALSSVAKPATEMSGQVGLKPPELHQSMYCVEQVEKAVSTETISEYDAQHVVDKTFTSTKYYQSLPEETVENVRHSFEALLQGTASGEFGSSNRTIHQIVTDTQCSQLTKKTAGLVGNIHDTLTLFVSDVDKNTMLRKVWGAMKNIATIIGQIQNRCSQESDLNEFTDPQWKAPKTGNRTWIIRTPTASAQRPFNPVPDVDPNLIESLRKCRRCSHHKTYSDPQAALEHLEKHLQSSPAKKTDLKNWILNDEQVIVEGTNVGYLKIVAEASDATQALFIETQQLAEGVQVEEGKMSELYTFPRELLKTLQRLVVFYLAIERAFHHTELGFEKADNQDEDMEEDTVPFSNMGIEVLSRFCGSARTSLQVARKELCVMARNQTPDDVSKRLNLGPEYLCSWFMRRLLVQPLYNSMAAADIYREYLSTLQFQVNHRPGKRLLRSINLLQEELNALEQVNVWQTKLIESYTRVLDDASYQIDIPSRRAFFQYERLLLESCMDNLGDTRDDYRELIRRCGPLSESTKQSAEINEEDHGKAIFVFTVVTVIFMPLSFVTSYLGMNTADIRDMENKQSLFWEIALPLTAVTMASILFVAYNGDELRDAFSSFYRRMTGKQDVSKAARGIGVAQRRRALKVSSDSSSTVDYRSLADEAEYTPPLAAVQFGFGQRPDFNKQVEYFGVAASAPVAVNYNDRYVQPVRKVRNYADMERISYEPRRRLQVPTARTAYSLDATQRPTYIRVARKYVDTETLRSYDIPWEIDSTNPDYFLLLKNMDQSEIDVLFDHTKRLKEIRNGNKGPRAHIYNRMEEKGGDLYGEKPREYEWVRKSKRTRRDSRQNGYRSRGYDF